MRISIILMDSFGRNISAEISARHRYIGVSADTGKVRFGRALRIIGLNLKYYFSLSPVAKQ